MVSDFLQSRRQGLSAGTILFYQSCLSKAIGTDLTPQSINNFLSSLKCNNGKFSYYRCIRALCNWLFKNDLIKSNPISKIEAPKPAKRILPSLTIEQVDLLISHADNLRDKTIISLFADSGMRLNELTNVKASDINWTNYTISIIGKGNKQRRAPFTGRSAQLLRSLISNNDTGENIWHMKRKSIQCMLLDLTIQTGIHCNPHSFRRGFACNLHRKGLSTLDIMHLGGWEDLSMVLRYTRTITFDDCLEHYKKL